MSRRAALDAGWMVLVFVAVALGTLIIVHAHRVPRHYATAYDGRDPGDCANGGSAAAPVIAHVSVRDGAGASIGTLRLRRSLKCAAAWPQLVLTRSAATRLKGRVVELDITRPADNETAPYPLQLSGGTIGFGNMVGTTSCVVASARLLGHGSERGGPTNETRCTG